MLEYYYAITKISYTMIQRENILFHLKISAQLHTTLDY
jgi:hypothetical protein